MMHPQDFRFPYEDWRTGKTRPEPIVQDDPLIVVAVKLAAHVVCAALLIFFVFLMVEM
jgi:hypothetical protein